MDAVTITANKREQVGSRASSSLRKEGFVPAVLYGHGEKSVHLAVPLKTLENTLRDNIRVMQVDVGGELDQVMVKDVQWDALGDQLLHIDLLRVRMDEVVSMTVSIEATGRAQGVEEGGILEMQRSEIRVQCLPGNIPAVIKFDVTELGLNESLHLSDLELPEGVTLDDDPEQVLISVVSRVEIAEEEAPVVEGDEAEVPGDKAEDEDQKEDKD